MIIKSGGIWYILNSIIRNYLKQINYPQYCMANDNERYNMYIAVNSLHFLVSIETNVAE